MLFSCSNFVQSKWGMEEFMIADEMMVNGRKDFLIVILKEQINMNKLPPELQTYLSKWLELLPKIDLSYQKAFCYRLRSEASDGDVFTGICLFNFWRGGSAYGGRSGDLPWEGGGLPSGRSAFLGSAF